MYFSGCLTEQMKRGPMVTAVMLVLVMVALMFVPRFFNREGFTSMSPANTYSAGYETRGPLDGKVSSCNDLVVAKEQEGPISVVRPGGSAFAPTADPKVDEANNQLYAYVRNQTSTSEDALLSSNLSTSTGAVVPTMEQVRALDNRGGNRASGVFI